MVKPRPKTKEIYVGFDPVAGFDGVAGFVDSVVGLVGLGASFDPVAHFQGDSRLQAGGRL